MWNYLKFVFTLGWRDHKKGTKSVLLAGELILGPILA